MEPKPNPEQAEQFELGRTDTDDNAPFKSDLEADHQNEVGYKEYVKGLDIAATSREETWIRWKIDLIVLPCFLVTQTIQYLDKTALNYANLFASGSGAVTQETMLTAKLQGYQKALGLEGDQFNYLAAIVYAGYWFGTYPACWLRGRMPAQRVIAVSCFFLGLMTLVLTQCRTDSSALAVRFILGFFEAAVTPCLVLMTVFWYTEGRSRCDSASGTRP